MRKLYQNLLCILLAISLLLAGCSISVKDISSDKTQGNTGQEAPQGPEDAADPDTPYITLNDNVPKFAKDEITTESFEYYSELDSLGRCGEALACVGTDLMPTEKRGSISRVKPTGWHSTRYDFVEGKNLFNRCHLIAYQLSGENANEKNLITGTRYMNVTGMLPFEEQVGDYVRETGNHVMYRVTPVFEGDNLIADGVKMEALSVEDNGKGVSYNVYVYNIQPGVEIDYATGESRQAPSGGGAAEDTDGASYVLNTNTKKFHLPSCGSAQNMREENRKDFTGDRETLIQDGYQPCGSCHP